MGLKPFKDQVFGVGYVIHNQYIGRPNANSWKQDLTGFNLVHENAQYVQSVSTPGYKKIRRRDLPVNPHLLGRGTWNLPSARCVKHFVYPDGRYDTDEYFAPAGMWGCSASDTGYGARVDPSPRAIYKLLDKVSLTKGNLAVGLAEVNKTAAHLAHTATRLYNAGRSIKRGDFSGLCESLGIAESRRRRAKFSRGFRATKCDTQFRKKFFEETWLEYTYGWVPLVQDVFTQTENLANFLTEKSRAARRVSASATAKEKFVETSNWDDGLGQQVKTIEVEVSYRYNVEYGIVDDGFLNTFGVKNLASVAWELTPFSFVIDTFWGVGKALEATTATAGLQFRKGSVTRKETVVINESITAVRSADYGWAKAWWDPGVVKASNVNRSKTRSRLGDFPSPPVFPKLRDPRSIPHMLSAISLLSQLFLGKNR